MRKWKKEEKGASMKMFTVVLFLLYGQVSFASWKNESRAVLRENAEACSQSEVVIDRIVKNDVITGHVTGIPAEALDQFKVVFYVKTNRWYVHPYQYYAGQEEGYSYSNLDADGKFKIKTIRREVPAQKLAAVLVPKPYMIKASRWWLKPFLGFIGGVLKFQCNHVIVKGNGDFFTESH